VTTFLECIAPSAIQVPIYAREALQRLGNRAMAHAMQQDIRTMAGR
jgi:hypothetical protein